MDGSGLGMPLDAALGVLLGTEDGSMDGSELGKSLGAALGELLGTSLSIIDGSDDGGALNVQFRVGVQARHFEGTCPWFGISSTSIPSSGPQLLRPVAPSLSIPTSSVWQLDAVHPCWQ